MVSYVNEIMRHECVYYELKCNIFIQIGVLFLRRGRSACYGIGFQSLLWGSYPCLIYHF